MADAGRTHAGYRQARWTNESADAERRRARRLKELGINPAGVEVILGLRRQIVAMHAYVQQLEDEIKIARTHSEARFIAYRQDYSEGVSEDTL